MKKVNFLGFAINQCGLKLQSEKISKIVEFKSPENANEQKSFLGVIVLHSVKHKFFPVSIVNSVQTAY